jgi:hypothetical protein
MRRRLFSLASLLSLMLCITGGAMWLRSKWWWENIPLGEHHMIESVGGRISVFWLTGMGPRPPDSERASEYGSSHHPPLVRHLAGFGYWFQRSMDGTAIIQVIVIPYWFPVAALVALPLTWMFDHLRRRRASGTRHCCACFYDLTGNTSGVCPECGTLVRPRQLESPDATIRQVTKQ